MKQKNLPKWSERTLVEKVFTCLIIIFGLLAILFILLESADVNIPKRLDSIFINLELISIGVVYYKHNRLLAIFLFIICGLSLLLTLMKMF